MRQHIEVKIVGQEPSTHYKYEEVLKRKGIYKPVSSAKTDNVLVISDGYDICMYMSLNQASDFGDADAWQDEMFRELRDCKVEITIK